MQGGSQKYTIPKYFLEPENPENKGKKKGCLSKNEVFTFSNLENKTEVALRTAKPDQGHLTVCNGLNLSGKCSVINCRANKDGLWMKIGYGKFEIGRIKTEQKCPICQTDIDSKDVKTLGYRNAKVNFKGVQIKDNKDCKFSLSDIADGPTLSMFSDADADIGTWVWLEIQVQKL